MVVVEPFRTEGIARVYYENVLRRDPCCYCKQKNVQPRPRLVKGERNNYQSVDHIIARSMGGENVWSNLTGSCVRCNKAKSVSSMLLFLLGANRL